MHTVWVSLSPIDDSGRGLWAILLAALRACPVVAVGNALHDLVPPDDPAADMDFLAAVADGLHAAAEPLTIVLDNTQDLTDPAAVDGLRSLLRDRPPHVRVVLAGRRDPPIHRGRLRAEGSLVEVRARERLRTGCGRGAVHPGVPLAREPVRPGSEHVHAGPDATQGLGHRP